ncbi:RNA polymerase sigma factor [Lutibacter sp.]
MTDKQLVSEIIKGNQLYFKILVDQYQSLVLNTCFSFVHNKVDAEDICQEVFIEVYLSIHKFKDQSKLSTWLYRIAVNKSLNYIRDNKKRNIFKSIENFFIKSQSDLQIPDDSYLDASFDEIEKERFELLKKAINKLPENQRIAFTLHKIKKMPYKKTAEIMNISLASVEGLIHRAKINVQKYILKKCREK